MTCICTPTSTREQMMHGSTVEPGSAFEPNPACPMHFPAPIKLYVCGPMTGIEGFNYEIFNIAAADLRASGYEVENPADLEAENTSGAPQAWDWYMRRAITKLMLCNGIALLNGWENSRGAVIEVNLAHNLGYQIRHIDAWLTA